jgi:hypothetical protein
MRYRSTVTLLSVLLAFTVDTLSAQDRVIDRDKEKAQFPDIYQSEKIQDINILNAYQNLRPFGHIVQMAKQDRVNSFLEIKDPTNFKYMSRFLRYTPRNSYIRYIKEEPDIMLTGFGDTKEMQGMISEKVKLANNNGVAAKEIQFAGRDGVELTQFEFMYNDSDPAHAAIGSKRKSLLLFFKPAGQTADARQALELDLVIGRFVEDKINEGTKNVEIIIDPTPLDEQMDDVIVIHRLNNKEPTVAPLGIMSNTPNYPHRLQFKQKFYIRLLDHFYRLYTLVDSYAKKDGNDFNDGLIEELEKSLTY